MGAKRRVVVTGGAGRIGRYVARELRGDHEVVVADLRAGEIEAEHVACDVLDLDAVRAALAGADAVCHLAGLDYDTHAAPHDFMRVNTVGTWHVLQAAAEQGLTRAVLASSSAAYGLFDLDVVAGASYLPIDEDHPVVPGGAYALSKVVTEEMGAMWARTSDLRVVCLQPLHVVLPETLTEFDAFVADADPRWPHNYVAVHDVATAFRAALDRPDAPFTRVLVGAEDSPLAEPTLDWYARGHGGLPPVRDPARYDADPAASLWSIDRARELLGWSPRTTLADLRALA